MEVRINDLLEIYEKEIKINVKNKKKLFNFEKNKMEYLIDIKRILETKDYDGGRYNIFLIYKPKIRIVMSQNIYDKIINRYITRHILMPKYTKYFYINETINRFSEKLKKELPLYNYNKELPIGNLSSQFLAILYLSD